MHQRNTVHRIEEKIYCKQYCTLNVTFYVALQLKVNGIVYKMDCLAYMDCLICLNKNVREATKTDI